MKELLLATAYDDEGWLSKWLTERRYPQLVINNKVPSLRKLSVINDKEGKKRIVAVFDYWSQCVLKPIHKSLSSLLRDLPRDCTFNQNNFKPLVSKMGGKRIYSIDLKAATDRMPLNLQAYVLAALTKDGAFAKSWMNIMTGLDFDSEIGRINYKVGQPMGAYSSWPMMALTHHAIVMYANSLCPRQDTDYYILGDDLVIIGDELFDRYQGVISELGMEMNVDKTFKSESLFEFAKRFFYNKEEISPFPLGAILQAKGDIALTLVGLDNAHAKSWLTDLGTNARHSLFQCMLKVFSGERGCSRHAASLLNWAYELQIWSKWVTNIGSGRPYGLTLLSMACNRTDDWHRKNFNYINSLVVTDVAKELLKQTRVHISQVRSQMDEFEDNYETLCPDLIAEDGSLDHPP